MDSIECSDVYSFFNNYYSTPNRLRPSEKLCSDDLGFLLLIKNYDWEFFVLLLVIMELLFSEIKDWLNSQFKLSGEIFYSSSTMKSYSSISRIKSLVTLSYSGYCSNIFCNYCCPIVCALLIIFILKITFVPTPSFDFKFILPPHALTKDLAVVNPIPTPLVLFTLKSCEDCIKYFF